MFEQVALALPRPKSQQQSSLQLDRRDAAELPNIARLPDDFGSVGIVKPSATLADVHADFAVIFGDRKNTRDRRPNIIAAHFFISGCGAAIAVEKNPATSIDS